MEASLTTPPITAIQICLANSRFSLIGDMKSYGYLFTDPRSPENGKWYKFERQLAVLAFLPSSAKQLKLSVTLPNPDKS